LFDEALYDIGAFGFLIDEARDRQYTGHRASLTGPSREMQRQTGKTLGTPGPPTHCGGDRQEHEAHLCRTSRPNRTDLSTCA
jgi:hypothetical protein